MINIVTSRIEPEFDERITSSGKGRTTSRMQLVEIEWVVMANYKNLHFLFLEGSGGSKAAKIASSNTFFRPFCNCNSRREKRREH